MSRSFEYKIPIKTEQEHTQMLYAFHQYLENIFLDSKSCLAFDADNLTSTIKNLNLPPLDLEAIWNLLSNLTSITRATYYIAIDSSDNSVTKKLDWMSHHGYTVVSKALKYHGDEPPKGDMVTEMIVDLTSIPYEFGSRADTVVLFSGNGDYSLPISKLNEKGFKTVVVSSILNGVVSINLRKTCSYFVELKTLVELANRVNMLNIKYSEDWLKYINKV